MNNNIITWKKLEGITDYQAVISEMEITAEKIYHKESSDVILLTEHKNIITAGTSASTEELVFPNSSIPIITTNRGGKYTFHGKGQRVIYPIINLSKTPWNSDLKKYVTFLQNWIIASLDQISIKAHRREDHIGVWVKYNGNDAKIAAIGIRVRKWVAYHGIAININTELENYNNFIPCGIKDLGVTSLEKLGCKISMEDFDEILKKSYYSELDNL